MIRLAKGNIFDSGCGLLVNPTNTEGIMGGGLALAFANRYPEMKKDYIEACKRKEHTVRLPYYWQDPWSGIWIMNLATKDIVANGSRIRWIAAGLECFATEVEDRLVDIQSAAFPALGCGLGGLDFKIVKPIMEDYLADLPMHIEIYVPQEPIVGNLP